jgi:hypothetical protein
MAEQGDEPKKNAASEIVVQFAGSTMGIAAQLFLEADFATTLAGGMAPVAGSALACALRERSRRISKTWTVTAKRLAAKNLDPGVDIFKEASPHYKARLELLAQVFAAAASTPLDEKVNALGDVLADGLADDAEIDDSFLLAASLDAIEAPHIEVLRHINAHPVPLVELRSDRDDEPRGWQADHLVQALPRLAAILDGLIAVLAGHGLLKDMGGVTYPGSVGPAVWTISDLGRRCLFLLDRRDEE